MQVRKSTLVMGAAARSRPSWSPPAAGIAAFNQCEQSAPDRESSPDAASPAPPSPPATGQAAGALTGEAASASAGDIPDNQVFLTLNDKALGFSMKYPEGWAQKAKGNALTIQDKNNIVRVAVASGAAPDGRVGREASCRPSNRRSRPSRQARRLAVTVSGHPAIKVTYTTVSAPNPVTGKRVTLMVDRYYFWQGGKVAVMDLGTPQGVDNVDAYRLMSESFAWK